MAFYLLVPGVYGEFGEGTVLDPSVHPPRVEQVHIVLDSPPRDDLHAIFPCFFVSRRLGDLAAEIGLTGATMARARVEMNEQYLEQSPSDPLPELYWLKITGRPLVSDFGMTADASLVVSERALSTIQKFRLNECLVYDAEKPPAQDQITADLWARAKLIAERHQ